MKTDITPEERKKLIERVKKQKDETDIAIKALLGEENYAVYKQYEDTAAERKRVQSFKGGLSEADALTDEQEDQLIRAMHHEQTNSPSSVLAGDDQEGFNPSSLSSDLIAKHLEREKGLQERYLVAAETILTPSQHAQFKAHLEKEHAMNKQMLTLTARMFGNSGQQSAGDAVSE